MIKRWSISLGGSVGTGEIEDSAVTDVKLGTDLTVGSFITIRPYSYDAVGQGTWAWVYKAAHGPLWQNSTAADADNCTYKVWLAAGTYTIWVLGHKNAGNGILKIDIDGTDVLTQDQYNGSQAVLQTGSATSVSVATSGLKTIKVKCDGKNASSSSYQVQVSSVIFQRTA